MGKQKNFRRKQKNFHRKHQHARTLAHSALPLIFFFLFSLCTFVFCRSPGYEVSSTLEDFLQEIPQVEIKAVDKRLLHLFSGGRRKKHTKYLRRKESENNFFLLEILQRPRSYGMSSLHFLLRRSRKNERFLFFFFLSLLLRRLCLILSLSRMNFWVSVPTWGSSNSTVAVKWCKFNHFVIFIHKWRENWFRMQQHKKVIVPGEKQKFYFWVIFCALK